MTGRGRTPATAGAMSALHRDGYLILPDLLTPDTCSRIRAEAGRFVDRTSVRRGAGRLAT
ncbi:hypothetical protein [Nonomuraea sp. NPDC005650]|uniref:hypothetical protein n=1 Tax=Nonomuraea sp. NPDC005650 TaxID=3157045 RepID=UPI0033AE3029